jgi:hypothetical protein
VKAPRLGENLLSDGGFERPLEDWEIAMPAYDGMRVERDTTVARSGQASVRGSSGTGHLVEARAGIGAVFCNRALAGKRVRLSGYIKTDSLKSPAMCLLYAHAVRGSVQPPQPHTVTGTRDWTFVKLEMDCPADTYAVWAWFGWNAPNPGRVWFDDLALEVVGQAKDPMKFPPKPPGR